jgi:Protein of unknown function (DUF3313)
MRHVSLLAPLLLVTSLGSALAAEMPKTWDGLVEVKPKRLDAAYVLPGADFRPYTKVMLGPTQVAFKKDWLRSMNDNSDLSRMVTQEDADRILSAARENFDDIFAAAWQKAGYTVVTKPGPDVVAVATAIANLYVNAPDVPTGGRTYTFTTEAGEATLILEVRDSMTGALLGRALDRRETRSMNGMQISNSASNKAEFRQLFKQWADIATKGMEELKAQSPVPTDLKPGAKP